LVKLHNASFDAKQWRRRSFTMKKTPVLATVRFEGLDGARGQRTFGEKSVGEIPRVENLLLSTGRGTACKTGTMLGNHGPMERKRVVIVWGKRDTLMRGREEGYLHRSSGLWPGKKSISGSVNGDHSSCLFQRQITYFQGKTEGILESYLRRY